jgi:hypothetical protein
MNNGNRFFKYAGILNIKRYALFQRAETPGAKNINVLYHILNTHFGARSMVQNRYCSAAHLL